MAQENQDNKIVYYPMAFGKKMTVEEWMKLWQVNLPKEAKRYSASEFLSYKNKEGQSNLDIIWGTYDKAEKSEYEQDYNNKNLPYVKANTVLNIPMDATPLNIVKPSNDGQFLTQDDFEAYWSENYKSIITDKEYVPEENVTIEVKGTGINLKTFSLNVRVYIYIRALDKVIDISPYIINLNTTKSKEVGVFSIDLSPFYFNGSSISFGSSSLEVFNTLSNSGALVRDFLEKKVQQNDIVFIRFERLKKEKDKSETGKLELEIPLSKLAGNNVWDMIGFVDTCTISYNGSMNDRTLSIQGRDLSKMFTDDGCYFIPKLNITDTFSHWYNEGGSDQIWYKRNIIDGMYNFMWSYGFKRINECIWFILNVMSNIKIVDNKVFDSWKEKRTEAYKLEGVDVKDQQVNGIWQIVKVFIDENIKNRVLVETNIGNPNGTLIDYMSRICQMPFVEFYFDTYVNTMDIIVRQPPFNEKAITQAYKNKQYVTIKADDVYSLSLTYDSRCYSWYQLKVVNNFTGNNNTTSLAFVPIVYLDEYVSIFGNKKLEVTNSYLSMDENEGVDKITKLYNMQAAALNDLIYLVESNAYLPFTRTGTISINGDRRIKVGTFIKCELTNEFFYVTSVTNSLTFSGGSLTRQTVLTVERGMYIPILEGNGQKIKERQDNSGEMDSKNPSYFKIVDLSEMKKAAKQAEKGNLSTLMSPKIDKDQFDFFVNRKMFS